MTSLPRANVIRLRDARRARVDRQTLCRSGFHKWQVLADRRFDVKAGMEKVTDLINAKSCKR